MKKLIGLDIGSYSIKAIDVKVSPREIEIKNFGYDVLSRESIVEGEIMDNNLIEEIISTIFSRRKIKNKNLSISVSGRNLILKAVQIDAVGEDKVRNTLEYEFPNHIPYERDDIFYDFSVVSEQGGRSDVLLAAAKKEVVVSRVNLLKSLGLMPLIVDTAALAVQNVYEALHGPITGTVFMADIGAEKTSFSIIVDGVPKFVREIPLGGNHYTDVIAKELGVNYDVAEKIKTGQESTDANLIQMFDATNQNLSNQMKRSMEYIRGSSPIVLGRGIITGGGAMTPGLLDFLKNEMDTSSIEKFNPIEHVKASAELMPELEKAGPALSVALGLAMRKVK